MVAKITLSLDLIGGHSLVGPINRLQNAISFNYYANTEMYDPRADSIDKSKGVIVDGIRLSQKKAEAGVDIKKLTDSLKSEGIINQKDDSKTGDNSQTTSSNEIEINPDGKKVIVKSNGETKVKIYTQKKSNFNMVINSTQQVGTIEYDLTKYLSDYESLDKEIIELTNENNELNTQNTNYEATLNNPSANTNINKTISDLNKNKKKIEKNNKKIDELKAES